MSKSFVSVFTSVFIFVFIHVSYICSFLLSPKLYSNDSYNEVDRYLLYKDRFDTFYQFDDYKKDFVFPLDLYVAMSPDALDIYNDSSDLAQKQNVTVSEVNALLEQYINSENVAHFSPLNFNFGLSRFSFFDMKVKPSIRLNTSFGGLAALNEAGGGQYSTQAVLNFVPPKYQIPEVIAYLDSNQPFSPGGQIIDFATCSTLLSSSFSSAEVNEICQQLDRFRLPSEGSAVLNFYLQAEARLGVHFDYYSKSRQTKNDKYWYGSFFPYFLVRSDYNTSISADTIVLNTNPLDLYLDNLSDFINYHLAFNYELGYRMRPFDFKLAIEDVVLAESDSDNTVVSRELDPLLRLEMSSYFDLAGIRVSTFTGIHKRSGYGLKDGFYIGARTKFNSWSNKLKCEPRLMLDSNHLTLNFDMQYWAFKLSPFIRLAIVSEVDQIEVPSIFGLNLRVVQF